MTQRPSDPKISRSIACAGPRLWRLIPLVLATAASAQEPGKKVSATVGGHYNIDVVTPADPSEAAQGRVDGPWGQAVAELSEGGVSGVARAVTDATRLVGAAFISAVPHAGLGSSAWAKTISESYERFGFSAARDDIFGLRALVRVKGRVSFSTTAASRGIGDIDLTGFLGSGTEFERDFQSFRKDPIRFSHFMPSYPVTARKIDETGSISMQHEGGNLLEFFLPMEFTLKVRLAAYINCSTGHDSKDSPLPANAHLFLGTSAPPPVQSPPAPRLRSGNGEVGIKAHTTQEGAAIVGLQFLDAQGRVLDVQPSEVTFQTETGSEYPILGPTLPWLSGSDDFDDSVRDAAFWTESIGSGSLQEKDFVLEYFAPAGTHSAHCAMKQHKGSLDESWEVQADVHLEPLTLSQTGEQVGVGPRASANGYSAELRLERTFRNGTIERRFNLIETTPTGSTQVTMPAPQAEAAVRFSYNALTKQLRSWFDPNGATGGYAWTLLKTINLETGGWQLPPAALISMEIGGGSAGPAVTPGNAWLDNFSAGSWKPLAAYFDQVLFSADTVTLVGCGEPGTRLAVEASTDLITWSHAADITVAEDGSLAFTRPTQGTTHQFFRIQ